MKRILFQLICMACFFCVYASKPDSILVYMNVFDSFSGEQIDSAKITVMRPDSVIIGTVFNQKGYRKDLPNGGMTSFSGGCVIHVPISGHYLVKILCPKYKTMITEFLIPQKKYYKWVRTWNQEFFMKRIEKIHEVSGSAVVRATKIKMVMKGDTVVYNADAFQLSDGSMLDKLIRSLPGVELDENGNITQNGHHIDELLVNGKQFFKGNPKIALENLPAYIVDKVKIYRKSTPESYLTNDNIENEQNKKLVVDVNLKKEYNSGWLTNVDVGVGTNERYLAKVFGLHYTDCVKVFMYANMNNLSISGTPFKSGIWQISPIQEGTETIRNGGVNFNCENKKMTSEMHLSLNVSRNTYNNEQKLSGITYLQEGNLYNRLHSCQQNDMTTINNDGFYMYEAKRYFIGISHSISYEHTKKNGSSLQGIFNADPRDKYMGESLDSLFLPMGSNRLNNLLINTVSDMSESTRNSFRVNESVELIFTSPLFGNKIICNNNFAYGNISDRTYSHYLLTQRQLENSEFQNKFINKPTVDYSFSPTVQYIVNFGERAYTKWNYSYQQTYNNKDRNLYRLDSLANWSQPGKYVLGALPSTRDSLLVCRDLQNSFHSTEKSYLHKFRVYWDWSNMRGLHFGIELPLLIGRYSIEDDRFLHRQLRSKNVTFLSPSIEVSKNKFNPNSWIFEYRYSPSIPEMKYLLDIQDDSDPLFVQLGNPKLKNSAEHHISFSKDYQAKMQLRHCNFNSSWSVFRNMISQTRLYDRLTGITTYKPKNVDGNWQADVTVNYGQALDSLHKWIFDSKVTIQYVNNADYVSEKDSEPMEPYRRSVRNLNMTETMKLSYSLKNVKVVGNVGVAWNRLASNQNTLTKISAWNLRGGVSAEFSLWWNMILGCDLTLYSRRGYNDASMNDDNLVWNADITKSFLKSKNLILKLEGFDLLHQLDNVRTEVNAQGRTETWYNVVPSYLMLHLIYKLNVLPKKK